MVQNCFKLQLVPPHWALLIYFTIQIHRWRVLTCPVLLFRAGQKHDGAMSSTYCELRGECYILTGNEARRVPTEANCFVLDNLLIHAKCCLVGKRGF